MALKVLQNALAQSFLYTNRSLNPKKTFNYDLDNH
jgi:hypothetical protein